MQLSFWMNQGIQDIAECLYRSKTWGATIFEAA
jgi:hypothetical protein